MDFHYSKAISNKEDIFLHLLHLHMDDHTVKFLYRPHLQDFDIICYCIYLEVLELSN